eukprot:8899976-Pyramimonas_sp.AAC.1
MACIASLPGQGRHDGKSLNERPSEYIPHGAPAPNCPSCSIQGPSFAEPRQRDLTILRSCRKPLGICFGHWCPRRPHTEVDALPNPPPSYRLIA